MSFVWSRPSISMMMTMTRSHFDLDQGVDRGMEASTPKGARSERPTPRCRYTVAVPSARSRLAAITG
jgi:hypothetical protein